MKKSFTFLFGIISFSCFINSAYATSDNQPGNPDNSVYLQTDTVAPVVMDFHIEFSEEPNDSVSAVFTITYSEDVNLVDNYSIVSHNYVTDGWVDFGRYDDTEVSVVGNVITITPSHNFFSLERYELVISAGSVEDMNGNSAKSFTRVFIANTDAPEVSHYEIELSYNQMMDSVSAVFQVHYNENVQLSDTFQIVTHIYSSNEWETYDRYDHSEVTVTGNVITVVPTRMFSVLARYEFIITFGSVQDLAGNFAPSFARVFVADTTSPEVTNFETEFIPTAFPDSTNAMFTLTYNEDVQLSPLYNFLTFHRNSGVWEEYEIFTDTNIVVSGNTITIHPTLSFSLTESYELVITAGSVRDLVGNLATSFTNVFLLDTISPTLLSVDPDISQLVELDAAFTFTFDENVRLVENFGFYTYYWDADSARYIQIERLNASQVTVEDNKVTFSPSVGFWSNHQFQIILTSGSVLDFEGNPFIHISGNDTTTFFSERFWTVVTTNVNLTSSVTFDVYPNPFSDYINISNSDRLIRIIVANIAGQRVIDIKNPGREINTSHLVSGVYLINMQTEDGSVKTKRFMKR